MAKIHPSALVDPKAELDNGVEVGAYSIIGPKVKIGANTVIGSHVIISGHTQMGRDNQIFQFCSIGGPPQDKKYQGETTYLEIGDRNTIRESCTLNTGTVQDGSITRVGTDNWIMAYVHIAHDCQLGNHLILANGVQLAGHVHIQDWAILGGLTGVHQFVHIGAHAMTGAGTIVIQDIPPFVMTTGNPAGPHGINSEGLKRRGFSKEIIAILRNAYKVIYKMGLTLEESKMRLIALAEENCEAAPHLQNILGFLDTATRGIVR